MVTMKTLIEEIKSEKYGVEHYLHKLIKLAITMTGRGTVHDDYTGSIDIEVGGFAIYSDPYYNQITIYTQDDIEMRMEREDEEVLRKLADELKKRILTFERKIRNVRNEKAAEVFDRPLGHIIAKDIEERTT